MKIFNKTAPKGIVSIGNKPNKIVLHHYAGYLTPDDLISFHTEKRGFDWAGYHYSIYENGKVYQFRKHEEVGAHERKANKSSIGIALAGHYSLKTPTKAQIVALRGLITELRKLYPGMEITAHRDYKSTECPGKLISDSWIKDISSTKCDMAIHSVFELVSELMKRLKR